MIIVSSTWQGGYCSRFTCSSELHAQCTCRRTLFASPSSRRLHVHSKTSPADVTLTPNHGPERTSRRRQRQLNYVGYQIRMARRQRRHAQNEPAESANGL